MRRERGAGDPWRDGVRPRTQAWRRRRSRGRGVRDLAAADDGDPVRDDRVRDRAQPVAGLRERGSRGRPLRRRALRSRGDAVLAGPGSGPRGRGRGGQRRERLREREHRLLGEPRLAGDRQLAAADPDRDPVRRRPERDREHLGDLPMRVTRRRRVTLTRLVRPSTAARLRGDDGVTGMWFAVLLVVFLGMLALSMDGGLLFVRFRAIRNANDAAALAAAQSCARGNGLSAANAQADTYAGNKPSGALRYGSGNVYDPACDPSGGKVTVHYQGTQDLYVAPAIGVNSPKTIQAQATALWGAAGGASNVAPLMLSAGRLSTCGVPDTVQIGDHCFFWWDNGNGNNTTELSNAEWGLMDLRQWGVARNASCPGNVNQQNVTTWIRNGFPGTLMLRQPPPTYVCRGSGFQGNALNQDINSMVGRQLVFPVNDSSQQVQANGNLCRPGNVDGACTVHKYAIVSFGIMEIVQVWTGQTAQTKCQHPAGNNGSIRCLEAIWRGPLPGGIVPCTGCENFGLFSVQLSE